MKRIFAAILTVILLLGAVSCGSRSSAPKGYMSASLDSEIFELYIPQSWQSNVESGVSGGYSSDVMASATTFRTSEVVELETYAQLVVTSYGNSLIGFEKLTEFEQTTLGSVAALRFDYKARSAGKSLQFRCTLVKNKDAFTVLTCCAPEETFADNVKVFDEIASHFTFRDFEVETEEPVVLEDEKTPAGFQLATRSKLAYRLYVPKTWTVNTKSAIPSAYFSDSDPSNVRMTSMLINTGIVDGESYWKSFKDGYAYELTEVSVDTKAKMGQYDALAVEYITTVSGQKYYIKQVFLTAPDVIYTFTYTSDEAHYAEHMDDVNTMLSMFEFK